MATATAITITKGCVHIPRGYMYSRHDFGVALQLWALLPDARDCEVFARRSRISLCLEWAAHNALYFLGISRKRTSAVDLETPQPLWLSVAWSILGGAAWFFIP